MAVEEVVVAVIKIDFEMMNEKSARLKRALVLIAKGRDSKDLDGRKRFFHEAHLPCEVCCVKYQRLGEWRGVGEKWLIFRSASVDDHAGISSKCEEVRIDLEDQGVVLVGPANASVLFRSPPYFFVIVLRLVAGRCGCHSYNFKKYKN